LTCNDTKKKGIRRKKRIYQGANWVDLTVEGERSEPGGTATGAAAHCGRIACSERINLIGTRGWGWRCQAYFWACTVAMDMRGQKRKKSGAEKGNLGYFEVEENFCRRRKDRGKGLE
jgi:hypothetical protein